MSREHSDTGPHICVDLCNSAAYLRAMDAIEPHAELDAIGLLCPLPVLKARKRLEPLSAGQVLKVLADDPAAVVDVPHFCAEAGHELVGQDTDGPTLTFFIRKGR